MEWFYFTGLRGRGFHKANRFLPHLEPCSVRPVRFLAVHGAARALRAIFSGMELPDVELTFEVHDAVEGGYCAHAVGHSIFTEGETWEELRGNVREATLLHFEDGACPPSAVHLHYVREEFVPLAAA